MKALVAVKRVIDYNVKVRVKADNSDVDLANTKMSINPFCEIAVEEAVRLKEAGVVSEIVVVSIGDKSCQEQMRYAMALGADRGVQVEAEGKLNSLDVARILAKVNESENAGIFILGKQAIDSDNNQTGQMLAALLDVPQATFASEVKIADGKAQVTREVDGGLVTVEMDLPAVITTDLRLNEPRFAALPKIMQAKRKPLDVKTLADLGVELTNSVELISVETPAERSGGIKVDSVDALIDKLRNEAQVI
ncbi:Electron transfer flavoprotein subunit beta [Marinobacterium sp. xm-a-121]|jgi:electron transfer flavoprotein beta subunit|uniref:electron transfer flavoprotein subunit beta/FixA family protein n=1 Tax=unclassified Marinobacterium TaxID=2644139 RepID=UPI001567CA77|nr:MULTISPECIES: electron transfer flavoprotein subunit beta/FixA family protein [unclassified Marinobacterium]NRP10668.1 Electron transfer flavoprotein subunit beta [Marinobacterium sp. xm-g-48]NRP38521.1 Electron transfer flavoprotein subunit beta [Marinobacterium sp. xm-a-121]NRP46788.1 Electron transfer flavoprotein subunit beta [Marinobacterium sp. xm-d-543]NRP83628.1 Electron transfer flavoprotein subunit beta [Marinobacterium sp. xm-d-509]NRP99337.1 Electron transfer flavoprotein subuni